MKELLIKGGRPLLNYVILTANRYSAEELAESHGGIIVASKVNQLKEYQTIVSISPRLVNTGLEVGQLVLINIERYGNVSQKKDSLKQSTDEYYNAHVTYRVPVIELDGVEHLKLGDNDIEFIIDDFEFVDSKKESPIILDNSKGLIIPDKSVIL